MKKIIPALLFLLFALFIIPVYGVEYPQGSFVLSGGNIRVSDVPDPFEIIDKTFFASLIIPVKDGVINFYNTRPIDLESGSQHFIGTMDLRLNGDYDKDTGVISADFTQSQQNSYDRKTGNGIRVGSGSSVFTGTVKGTVIDNQVVLSFEGKLSSESTSEANDKHVDNYSSAGVAWVKKVAFGTSEWVPQSDESELPPEESGRDSGARASDLSGQVEIACPPDLEAWDVMKMGRVIYVNCHIKTGEGSKAVISFSDMTTFVVKAESEIVIDTPPEKDSKVKLLAGNIWANVKKMVKDGTMEVHMGQAVAGIKGTTFVLEETPGLSTIKVIEGIVAFKSNATNDEKLVNSGEILSATDKGLGVVEKFDIASENARWGNDESKVETTPKTARNNYILPIIILVILGISGFAFFKSKQKN